MLTERQALVLQRLVEEYLDGGAPVGSKFLASQFTWGPSTIRNELASLEEIGLLQHPHTSAGRVPTEAGYRYFVDQLLGAEPEPASTAVQVRTAALSLARYEVEEAMRVTTETLSQVTDLLALVTAPPIDTATIRHIEVLSLQPQVLMVVVITSTGGVSKRIFTFDAPLDSGLVDWAASYLNERLAGTGLGARMLGQRLRDPSLSATEVAFLAALAPVFNQLASGEQDSLYVDGAGRLLSRDRVNDVGELNAFLEMLERRVSMLGVLRNVLTESDVLVRIGAENDVPALNGLSLVAVGYGLPQRPLGSVSVIGPVRMDYRGAIRAVRGAAAELSSYVTEVYEQQ